jgi:hypothetical protein
MPQQSRLFVHRARQGDVEQHTALINRILGLLSELSPSAAARSHSQDKLRPFNCRLSNRPTSMQSWAPPR